MKRLWQRFKGIFSEPLPVGIEEFQNFCDSIFDIYQIPDMLSYRNAVATMVMHLPPTTDRAPKSYFAKSLRKAMANQISYEIIQRIRDEQVKIEQKEKEVAKELAATQFELPLESQPQSLQV